MEGELDRMKDETGFNTLDTISGAGRFNEWMASTLMPWCRGEILEIGGGIGNISRVFLEKGYSLTVTELREEYCDLLKQQVGKMNSLREILQMDITDPAFNEKFGHLSGKFDTVFALNVLEHIVDRETAVRNCRALLKTEGTLIILVPAFQSLYNRFDAELGHHLRFTQGKLSGLLNRNGFRVLHRQFFNSAGIAGWWFAGSIMRKKMIPEGSMRLYNLMVPLFRILDQITHRIVGLSIIQVGFKTGEAIPES